MPHNAKNALRKRIKKSRALDPAFIVVVRCWAAVYMRNARELSETISQDTALALTLLPGGMSAPHAVPAVP